MAHDPQPSTSNISRM